MTDNPVETSNQSQPEKTFDEHNNELVEKIQTITNELQQVLNKDKDIDYLVVIIKDGTPFISFKGEPLHVAAAAAGFVREIKESINNDLSV